MPLHPAIRRLAFLPILVLLICTTSCGFTDSAEVGPGTIRIRILVAGAKGIAGHGIEHCKQYVEPKAILKSITVRDGAGWS